MSGFKGTPGPWHTEGDGIVRHSNGAGIMANSPIKLGSGWREDSFCGCDADNEVIANARLIAAAPTMRDYIARKAGEGDAEARQILEAIDGHS